MIISHTPVVSLGHGLKTGVCRTTCHNVCGDTLSRFRSKNLKKKIVSKRKEKEFYKACLKEKSTARIFFEKCIFY